MAFGTRLNLRSVNRMATIMFRRTVWLGGWAVVAATAAACLYCTIRSLETTLFGMFVIPFVAPSVVLFLILEGTCLTRLPKYLGFFLPMFVIVGACFYQICSLRSQAVLDGYSDGGADALVYFVECYVLGLCCAFACLLLGRKGCRR